MVGSASAAFCYCAFLLPELRQAFSKGLVFVLVECWTRDGQRCVMFAVMRGQSTWPVVMTAMDSGCMTSTTIWIRSRDNIYFVMTKRISLVDIVGRRLCKGATPARTPRAEACSAKLAKVKMT